MAEPICSMVPLRKSPPIRVARDRKSTRLNPVTVNLVCRLLLEKKKTTHTCGAQHPAHAHPLLSTTLLIHGFSPPQPSHLPSHAVLAAPPAYPRRPARHARSHGH